jgi:hypothetical protein
LSIRRRWRILWQRSEDLILRGNRFRLIGRVLALALLVAQFGAEIHVYSHSLTDPSDRFGTARSCGTCLASSQLQNAVAPPSVSLPSLSTSWVTIVPGASVSTYRSEPFRAFRSRAPPVLA